MLVFVAIFAREEACNAGYKALLDFLFGLFWTLGLHLLVLRLRGRQNLHFLLFLLGGSLWLRSLLLFFGCGSLRLHNIGWAVLNALSDGLELLLLFALWCVLSKSFTGDGRGCFVRLAGLGGLLSLDATLLRIAREHALTNVGLGCG